MTSILLTELEDCMSPISNYFYKLFAVIEAALTAAVVWIAWKWPRDDGAD